MTTEQAEGWRRARWALCDAWIVLSLWLAWAADDGWADTLEIVILPPVLAGLAWRVLAWVRRGFQGEKRADSIGPRWRRAADFLLGFDPWRP